MDTLEKEIIRRYRQVYPKDTLKMISEKTGIQITRVFRIMNGKPMKVKELEVFERVINQSQTSNKHLTEFERLTKMALSILSVRDLNHIAQIMERKIQNAHLKVSSSYFNENENLIA